MTHVVPDNSQIIEKLIWQIQQYARQSTDPFEKKRAQRLLERLGLLLEQSYAWLWQTIKVKIIASKTLLLLLAIIFCQSLAACQIKEQKPVGNR